MKKSELLLAKYKKHNAYCQAKRDQYLAMEKNPRSLNRLGRLMDLNGQLMQLALEINNALLDELTEELAEETEVTSSHCDYCGQSTVDSVYNALDGLAICDDCVPSVLAIMKEDEDNETPYT